MNQDMITHLLSLASGFVDNPENIERIRSRLAEKARHMHTQVLEDISNGSVRVDTDNGVCPALEMLDGVTSFLEDKEKIECLRKDACQSLHGLRPAPDQQAEAAATPAQETAPARSPKPKCTVVHMAVCDNCRNTIRGIRYKCSNCADYDLCEKCEENWIESETHDVQHVFLKMEQALRTHNFTPLPSFVSAFRGPAHWRQHCCRPFPSAASAMSSQAPAYHTPTQTKEGLLPRTGKKEEIARQIPILREERPEGTTAGPSEEKESIDDRLSRLETQLQTLCQILSPQ